MEDIAVSEGQASAYPTNFAMPQDVTTKKKKILRLKTDSLASHWGLLQAQDGIRRMPGRYHIATTQPVSSCPAITSTPI